MKTLAIAVLLALASGCSTLDRAFLSDETYAKVKEVKEWCKNPENKEACRPRRTTPHDIEGVVYVDANSPRGVYIIHNQVNRY